LGCVPESRVEAPALFRALPWAAERFPWLPLGDFPTPVERIEGLLPPQVELWVKREDRSSAAYGGNKVRKLEFLLGAARAAGQRTLYTFGGTGSHHVAATTVHGARQGFAVEAFVFPQPIDDHVRELGRLERAAGATLRPVGSPLGALPARLRALRCGSIAWLPGGGSCAIGTLGWVSGALEVSEQVARGELPRPDVVYCALGSCGTAAGLWWGLRGERPIELTAVRVVGWPMGEWATRRLCHRVARTLAPCGELAGEPARLRVEHGFLGRGYGWPSRDSEEAVALAAQHGLALDPIYTGKVMAAVLADARAGRLDGKRVLFVHTMSGPPGGA
jgi:D-cysteine desulfhydrase